MNFVAKHFDELATKELYELLKARMEVFVVEQNIKYQDLDDVDYNAYHIFYERDGKVKAYLRAFPNDDDDKIFKIGRVLTIERGTGLGKKLLEEGIKAIKEKTNARKMIIDAQKYTIGFYEKVGFKVTSGEFLEEGIVHVKMELEL